VEHLNNYNLEWELYATGPAMIEAFKLGSIDLGYIGLPPVMIGIENGLNLKCVAGGHIEGTIMIASKSYPSFHEIGNLENTLKQFVGKIIGTPSKGCIHDVIMRWLVKDLDIEIKNYQWADFIPDALDEGEIDAAVGTPSLATVILKEPDYHVVIPPDNLWPWNPSYGIVVQEKIIDESPDFIIDFLKAHEEASNLIRNNPNDAARRVSREIEFMDENFVLKTYSMSPKYCASIPQEYIDSTLNFNHVLKNSGYSKGNLSKKDIFKLEFIEDVHPEPSHYNI